MGQILHTHWCDYEVTPSYPAWSLYISICGAEIAIWTATGNLVLFFSYSALQSEKTGKT